MRKVVAAIMLMGVLGLGVYLWVWVNKQVDTSQTPEVAAETEAEPTKEVVEAPLVAVEPEPEPKPPMIRENFALIAPLHHAAAAGDIYAVRSYLSSGAPLDEPGQDGMTPLLAAAKNGNPHVAVSLMEAGANFNLRDELGNSAFHLASAADEIYTVETLHTKGLPLFARNKEDYTVLHSAAKVGALKSILYFCMLFTDFSTPSKNSTLSDPMHLAGYAKQFDALRVFIKMGYTFRMREAVAFGYLEGVKEIYSFDPLQIEDAEDTTYITNLLLAVGMNHEDIVRFLLEKGASLYSTSSDLYDTMGLAIIKNFPNMIKLLLENGYDINTANITKFQDTPLQFAIRIGYDEAVQILLENNADLNILGGKGLSSLHVATYEKRFEMAKLLLEKGANVNINDTFCADEECESYGNTPLQLAITENLPEFVNLYLDNGADINTQRKDGQTPLHLAVLSGNEEYVGLLLAKQADVLLSDMNGRTALHVAAMQSNENIVKKILDAGAEIEAIDKDGRKPLHLAASLGREKIAKLLLERGGDLESVDHLDKTPLYVALENAQKAVAHLLLESNAKTDALSREKRNLLFPAVQSNMPDEIAFLLEKGLDINHADHQGLTPLHLAAQYSTEETLKYLLEHGANPNVMDRFSQTPLHFAADRGFTVFIRELLLAGADVRAETRWGQFPIHRSALSGHWGAIHYFLIADTSLTINTPDANGNTPLHMALQSGMPSLVEVMIERGADILKRNERNFSPLSAVSKLRYATIHPQDNKNLELKKREGYKVMTEFLRAALFDRLRAAVYKGNLEEVTAYLSEEPSLLNVMVNGECPLHLAARLGNLEMVKKLMEFGANTEYRTQTVKPATAAELAIEGGHPEIAEYLGSLAKAA